MLTQLSEYYLSYPRLVIELIEYFSIDNREVKPDKKSIEGFCAGDGGKVKYQPHIVDRICKRLCEKNILTCIRDGSSLGLKNSYIYIPKVSLEKDVVDKWEYTLNSIVYGFQYIYYANKDNVLPLVWDKGNGDYSAGTGFRYRGGIVTAKHCVEDVKNLRIRQYDAKTLEKTDIYISECVDIDIAFFDLKEQVGKTVYSEKAEVLDDVIVMGYPRIPAFTDFLTAERATVSAKAESRITPTVGSVAALGYEYLTKSEALLITAKIAGGNSGGPVFNSNGCVVGVVSHIPNYDGEIGDYDNLGYGIAIPISIVDTIIDQRKCKYYFNGEFMDW